MPRVPRILHFIWAGGRRLMPPSHIQNVFSWATAQPDFRILIWVDQDSDPQVFSRYEQLHDLPRDNIEVVDLVAGGICNDGDDFDDLIRYELRRIRPNYGTSSDLLRYKILYKMGGAYFDCGDVLPAVALSRLPLFADDQPEPVFLTYPRTQNTKLAGNDALIATPGHPMVGALVAESQKRQRRASHDPYKYCANAGLTSEESVGRWCYWYGTFRRLPGEFTTFERDTIDRTGPGLVRKLLVRTGDPGVPLPPDAVDPEEKVPASFMMGLNWALPAPHNTIQWGYWNQDVHVHPVRLGSRHYEDILNIARRNIHYEAIHMSTLRLDSAITDIARSLGLPPRGLARPSPDELTIGQDLLNTLAESADTLAAIGSVRTAQLLSRFDAVRTFHRQHAAQAGLVFPAAWNVLPDLVGTLSTADCLAMVEGYSAHVSLSPPETLALHLAYLEQKLAALKISVTMNRVKLRVSTPAAPGVRVGPEGIVTAAEATAQARDLDAVRLTLESLEGRLVDPERDSSPEIPLPAPFLPDALSAQWTGMMQAVRFLGKLAGAELQSYPTAAKPLPGTILGACRSLCVLIPPYQDPVQLERLLHCLAVQKFPAELDVTVVLIVDRLREAAQIFAQDFILKESGGPVQFRMENSTLYGRIHGLDRVMAQSDADSFLILDADAAFGDRLIASVASALGNPETRLVVPIRSAARTESPRLLERYIRYRDIRDRLATGRRLFRPGGCFAFRPTPGLTIPMDTMEDMWLTLEFVRRFGPGSIRILDRPRVYSSGPQNWSDLAARESRWRAGGEYLCKNYPELKAPWKSSVQALYANAPLDRRLPRIRRVLLKNNFTDAELQQMETIDRMIAEHCDIVAAAHQG